MVEVDHLTKRYGEVLAIHDVTFEAREGEILGFLGKNGAGKTTTMRIMTGFLPATSGTVRVKGYDIREDSLEARAQIGYLPETAPLYEDMSVQAYLEFCARLRQVPAREVVQRVESVMESVNIAERRRWLIGKLSKGLRRRVGLAQALVHNPPVLIMDEPTEGLDPEQIIEIRHLIQGLRGDHTVILSTHILPEAQMLADRIVIIDQGEVVAMDTTANLTAAVQRARRLRLEVDGPPAEVHTCLAGVPGVLAVSPADEEPDRHPRFIVESERENDIRDQIAATVVRAGWGLLELELLEPSLEDVFLHLTRQARSTTADGDAPGGSLRVKPGARAGARDSADPDGTGKGGAEQGEAVVAEEQDAARAERAETVAP